MFIKKYREYWHLTQEDMAKMAGVSVKTISQLENHQRSVGSVTVDTAIRICRAMGISMDEFTGKVMEAEEMDGKLLYENDFISITK